MTISRRARYSILLIITCLALPVVGVVAINSKCVRSGCFQTIESDPGRSGYTQICLRRDFKLVGIPSLQCRLVNPHQKTVLEIKQDNDCWMIRNGFSQHYFVVTCEGSGSLAYDLAKDQKLSDPRSLAEAIKEFDQQNAKIER